MKKDSQSRSWLLTQAEEKITFEDLQTALSEYVYIGQLEQGEKGGEQGYKHYQLYIENPSPIRFSTIKSKLPNCHLEERKGTKKQAYDYCTKPDTRIGEIFGNGDIHMSENQGRRNDLTAIIEMIEDGAALADIQAKYKTQYLMYQNRITTYMQSYLEGKFKDTFRILNTTYIHGSTGKGKTRYVMDKHGYSNVCRITNYNNPFDFYKNQKVIIFEEFRSSLKIEQMLNYLDGYPLALPARYGDKVACFDEVYIISNIPLTAQYVNIQSEQPATYDAFLRRIHNVWDYDKQIAPQPLRQPVYAQTKLLSADCDELPF